MPGPLDETAAFLAGLLHERHADDQARITRLIQQIVAANAFLSALDGVDGEAAERHRAHCHAERGRLVDELAGMLTAWTLAGGSLTLTPPNGVSLPAVAPPAA